MGRGVPPAIAELEMLRAVVAALCLPRIRRRKVDHLDHRTTDRDRSTPCAASTNPSLPSSDRLLNPHPRCCRKSFRPF